MLNIEGYLVFFFLVVLVSLFFLALLEESLFLPVVDVTEVVVLLTLFCWAQDGHPPAAELVPAGLVPVAPTS